MVVIATISVDGHAQCGGKRPRLRQRGVLRIGGQADSPRTAYLGFLFLHPPGITLLLTPLAALFEVIGTHLALTARRVITLLIVVAADLDRFWVCPADHPKVVAMGSAAGLTNSTLQ